MTLSGMEDEVARQLGRRIRALRSARGWTQEEFAERAGIHAKFVGAAERGERNLTLRNIVRIARGLDVPIGALFSADDERR